MLFTAAIFILRTSRCCLSVFLLPKNLSSVFGIFVVFAVEEVRGENIFASISEIVPKRYVRIVVVIRGRIFRKSAKSRFSFCFNK